VKDSIEMSGVVANALSCALRQDFCRVESPERMAWIVLLLKKFSDTEVIFPRGKWATIQDIEGQLDKAANEYIEKEDAHD
jgi:hypothetical protein